MQLLVPQTILENEGKEKRQRKGGMGPLCSLETEKWGNYAEKWADAGGR